MTGRGGQAGPATCHTALLPSLEQGSWPHSLLSCCQVSTSEGMRQSSWGSENMTHVMASVAWSTHLRRRAEGAPGRAPGHRPWLGWGQVESQGHWVVHGVHSRGQEWAVGSMGDRGGCPAAPHRLRSTPPDMTHSANLRSAGASESKQGRQGGAVGGPRLSGREAGCVRPWAVHSGWDLCQIWARSAPDLTSPGSRGASASPPR